MQQRRKLQKKRTNIAAFVRERDAIMEGINAGLADAKAGRLHTHEEVMALMSQKYKFLKRRTILDMVAEFGPSNIDPKANLKELYYLERAKKYGF